MQKFKYVILSSLLTAVIVLATAGVVYYKAKADQPVNTIKVIPDESNHFNLTKDEEEPTKEEANIRINNSRRNIITETVSKINPAIVGINVTEIRQYRDYFSQDPFWRQFFGDRVYNRQVHGLGSGAIISPDGYILTNDHVAGNADEVVITMTDGTTYDAEVIGSDQVSDVCLLKIDAQNLPYLRFGNSEDIIIGEWVIALGNPFGLFDINDKPTVTVGVVSATGMNLNQVNKRYYINMIQTDAAINSGNSGGPLVNSIGEMIGMNTLIYTAGGSSGSVGVGFAIPINKVKRIVEELKANGTIDRAFWTGLRIQMIDEGIAKYYDLPNTRGVIITQVSEDSPASDAGLETGDIVVKVGKFRINNDETMISVLQEFRAGDTVPMEIIRENKRLTKNMTLEKRPQ